MSISTIISPKVKTRKYKLYEPSPNVPFKKRKSEVSRAFCFTWNNYPSNFKEIFEADKSDIQYMIAGREVAPTTGTPHLQGYMKLSRSTTNFALQKRFSGAFFIKSKCSDKSNYKYCSKGQDFIEIGNVSIKQGSRTDLTKVKESVVKGETTRQIMDFATSLSQIQATEKYMKYLEPPRLYNNEFQFIWIYGATELGKTKYVLNTLFPNEYKNGDVYITLNTSQWWDGYDRHKIVIIDDFRSSFCTFSELLQLAQPIEKKIQVKGSTRQLVANTIVVTSCFEPLDVYHNVNESRDQFYRRLTKVLCFDDVDHFIDVTNDYKEIVHLMKQNTKSSKPFISPLDKFKSKKKDELLMDEYFQKLENKEDNSKDFILLDI